ncbi:DUF2254 domain-containing protein [Antarctobacter jejuensis]|uniref:DUF2254 domain-containing protein n=1 Tax=Antarctobacter jejuensis TaxID=1439938 RepID=UPI003FD4FFDE
MLQSLLRRLRQAARRIHFRVILFAVLTLVALALSRFLGPLIPDWLGERIGAESVDPILNTLASSMLAVTIFSLTIMTGALQTAAGNWTPRSHLVLRQDTITQSVLSTFLGAYLFAIVGIVMRAAHLFDDREIVVLFFMSLVVVALVLLSLIRWILHLEGLGSLPFTASRMEAEAAQSVQRSSEQPCHGANPLSSDADEIPQDCLRIRAESAGYLQQIFQEAIQAEAADQEICVYIPIAVGDYVLPGQTLACISGADELTSTTETILSESLPLAPDRSFEEDPLFGVTVLSEVAVRALSPGVNDPGTAIDVINRLARVLVPLQTDPMDEPEHDRLWVRPLQADDLVRAGFDPIARCAADSLEVHLRLQGALRQLVEVAEDPSLVKAARDLSQSALDRANADFTFSGDFERLRDAIG